MDASKLRPFLACHRCKELTLGKMYTCATDHNCCEECYEHLPTLDHGCREEACKVQKPYDVVAIGSKCLTTLEHHGVKERDYVTQLMPRRCPKGKTR